MTTNSFDSDSSAAAAATVNTISSNNDIQILDDVMAISRSQLAEKSGEFCSRNPLLNCEQYSDSHALGFGVFIRF